MKCLYQSGGKVPDETDRITEQKFPALLRHDPAHAGIKRREQHILRKDLFALPVTALFRHPSVDHGIHDGGLSGIRIADQRDMRNPGRGALLSLNLPLPADLLQLPAQLAQPVVDGPAVDLQLFFTFTTGRHGSGSAALPGLGLPQPAQARLQILKLRQLHLQLRLPGACSALKDLKDQTGPVRYRNLQQLLQVPDLGRRKRIIEDHAGYFHILRKLRDLTRLSLMHIQSLVRLLQLLRHRADTLHQTRPGKLLQLLHGSVEFFL